MWNIEKSSRSRSDASFTDKVIYSLEKWPSYPHSAMPKALLFYFFPPFTTEQQCLFEITIQDPGRFSQSRLTTSCKPALSAWSASFRNSRDASLGCRRPSTVASPSRPFQTNQLRLFISRTSFLAAIAPFLSISFRRVVDLLPVSLLFHANTSPLLKSCSDVVFPVKKGMGRRWHCVGDCQTELCRLFENPLKKMSFISSYECVHGVLNMSST